MTPHIQKTICDYVLNPPKPSKFPLKPLKILKISQEPLSFAPRPSSHSKILETPPEPHEMTVLPLMISKVYIFWSGAPFSVILVPKFSKFIALSFLTFIHNNCLFHCIYLSIVCFALGNSLSEPLFEDFQEQVFEDSEVFFSGNKASVLDHFVPIVFLSIL
jgi:hypothetical protein